MIVVLRPALPDPMSPFSSTATRREPGEQVPGGPSWAVGNSGNPGLPATVRGVVSLPGPALTTGPNPGEAKALLFHGTADQILPIDRCSRIILPALKKQGYTVTFRQFDGGHEIPPHIAREGMRAALVTGYTIPNGREAPHGPRALVEAQLDPHTTGLRATPGVAG